MYCADNQTFVIVFIFTNDTVFARILAYYANFQGNSKINVNIKLNMKSIDEGKERRCDYCWCFCIKKHHKLDGKGCPGSDLQKEKLGFREFFGPGIRNGFDDRFIIRQQVIHEFEEVFDIKCQLFCCRG